jgi:hypothetical protein
MDDLPRVRFLSRLRVSSFRMCSRGHLASDSQCIIVSVHAAKSAFSANQTVSAACCSTSHWPFNAAIPGWRVEGCHIIFSIFVIKG